MGRYSLVGACYAVACISMAAAQGVNENSTPPFTPAQETAIETLVGHWIAAHPETIRNALDPVRAAGLDDVGDEVFGNPSGDVSVVVFLDRGSTAGAATAPFLFALAETDMGLRIVIKELPLVSRGSVDAALIAFAARKQGVHAGLAFEAALSQSTPADGPMARAAAVGAGLDPVRLAADAADPAGRDYLRRTRALADTLGIRSAPTFVIGNRALVGLRGPDELRAAIRQARSSAPPPR